MKKKTTILGMFLLAVICFQAKAQRSAQTIYTVFSDNLSLTLIKTDTTITEGKNDKEFPTVNYYCNIPSYFDQDLFKLKIDGMRKSLKDLVTIMPWNLASNALNTKIAYSDGDIMMGLITIVYIYKQDGVVIRYVDLSSANKKIGSQKE